MRQRQSARGQRGPLRQPQVTKVRWSWGRVGYERAERPSEKIAGREGGETRNVRQSYLTIAAVGEVIHVKLT